LSHLVPLAGETIWVNGKAMFSYLESQFWEKNTKVIGGVHLTSFE